MDFQIRKDKTSSASCSNKQVPLAAAAAFIPKEALFHVPTPIYFHICKSYLTNSPAIRKRVRTVGALWKLLLTDFVSFAPGIFDRAQICHATVKMSSLL